MSALLRASARALPSRALGLHLVTAVLLVAVAWNGLEDDRAAVAVLRGVAVLLAAAVALAVDEAGAALLDAAPTPFSRRLAARLALCTALAVPLWAGALGLAAWRGAGVPAAGLTLELTALTVLGLAVTAALRRWWGVARPALVAGPLLLGTLLVASQLPQAVRLLVSTPLDPAWDAAHARWSVLLAAALAVLAAALADPATAGAGRRGRRSRAS